MTIHACSSLYLDKTSRAVGNMLHDAVYELGLDGTDFLNRFIQSGVAEQIENGSPKYIAGMSGFELLLDVMDKTGGTMPDAELPDAYDRSDAYWIGWVLTHYQCYSGRAFKVILDTIPFKEMLDLYGTLHEADIQKSYEVLDAHFLSTESRLKSVRKRCGMTQEELSEASGVSLNTIRAYEHKSKDLRRAQYTIIRSLSNALRCRITDLV